MRRLAVVLPLLPVLLLAAAAYSCGSNRAQGSCPRQAHQQAAGEAQRAHERNLPPPGR
ncbi:MAG: hypothetical protein RMM29_00900 [Planctomycetota bacterium]|nr:hypothetical protein [Planctomycetota bacterium]MDW8372193.1 hypothetical protein [Planctomycetota bacterium]